MQINFERSGGFAGMRLRVSVDSASLPAAAADELSGRIGDAGFFSLPPTVSSVPSQPDRYSYRITVTEEGRSHTVVVDEEAVPRKLTPLLEWLTKAAASG